MIHLVLLARMTGLPAAALFLLACTMLASPALGQKRGVPIDIKANSMTIFEKEFRAVFKGKVDAVRGRIKLKTDRLDVNYAEVKRKNGSKKIEMRLLRAAGNVVIVAGGQTIRARRARMDVRANRALITGNVRVYRGKSTTKGEKLHLNLSTGQSKMEGGGGRVSSSFE